MANLQLHCHPADVPRYQPGGSAGFIAGSGVDPLSNGTLCLRDAALMQRLGVNTIRVYNLDPFLNHGQRHLQITPGRSNRQPLMFSRSMRVHLQCSRHLYATGRQLTLAQRKSQP